MNIILYSPHCTCDVPVKKKLQYQGKHCLTQIYLRVYARQWYNIWCDASLSEQLMILRS